MKESETRRPPFELIYPLCCVDYTRLELIMHSVDFFFFSGGCDDMPILLAFFTNFSLETIYLSAELREKWPYLENYQSKKIQHSA